MYYFKLLEKTKTQHECDRETIEWGTYGKYFQYKVPKWVLIKDLGDNHIQNILLTQKHIKFSTRRLLIIELYYRSKNPEFSKEETK